MLLGDRSGLLLVVSAREDVAKRIESHLRNAGHPLRVLWAPDLDDVEEVLRRSPPDLLLCETGLPKITPQALLSLRDTLLADLPVILLQREHSIDAAVAALAAGADDLCGSSGTPALRHLEGVVIREFAKHHHLRALRLHQQRLAEFERRSQQLAANSGDAIARLHEGIVADANPAFVHLLGRDSVDDISGQPLIDLVVGEQRAAVRTRLRQLLKGKHSSEPLELVFAAKRGKVHAHAQLIVGESHGEPFVELLIRSEGGRGLLATQHTALKDRRAFADALSERVASPGAQVHAALLLQIDGFAALENRIGHVEAQEVSAQLAEAIHARLGAEDRSFAFATDQLTLLLTRERFDEIEQHIEFLRKEIAQSIFHTRRHEAHVTLTLALYPLAAGDCADDVIAQLVEGTRKATAKGGDRLAVIGAHAQTRQSERDLALRAARVRTALENDGLKLAYQAIASLEGDTRSHFDVLVRLIDESGKEWHAADFLPAAQQAKLMPQIDRWVVQRTLAIIRKRGTLQDRAVLFVKLSEDTLKDADGFLGWFSDELRTQPSQPIAPDTLVFQFQEVVIQNHVAKARMLSQSLRTLGAAIAIDHYGIGSASVQLLDHLPAAFVKFHASFTQNFADAQIQKRLTELIEAARHRRLKTIVSHVEDAHLMARLWQIGVNFIQGYHVQEPEVVLLGSSITRPG